MTEEEEEQEQEEEEEDENKRIRPRERALGQKSADQFLKLQRHEKRAHYYCLRPINIIFILSNCLRQHNLSSFVFCFQGCPRKYRISLY